ncbi:type I restriction enzyme, S subunit [Nitrosospira sp. Nsp14]|uniref:restriction endonuclease subunit S n=1 Tax=Nitrosospira sp. Nsp14 TaxID=1855333 RepID=UPI0008E79F42|nr:restriction endonuclease subunit S [Nitrosospira sp. Nsp14]SFH23778.1 type I restriction enzyme, S subunit [Nitrosospira sp. Nsp14]
MSDSLFPVRPLSELATAIKDGTHGTHRRVQEGVPLLSAKNISANGTIIWDESDDLISESEYQVLSRSFQLEPNDLLLTIVGSLGRRAIYAGERVTFQRSVAYVRPDKRKLDSRFLFHWMGHPKFSAELVRRSNATAQAGLYLGELAKVSAPIPIPSQQRAIAQILDTLDTAMHATEAIIAKLKAIKQGLLHDLVTRGIDANGELRPPQAEAPHLYEESPLGWTPKEWDVVTLESVSKTVTSGSRDWARFYADSGALFVRIGNLTREHINFRYESIIYVRPRRNADGQRTRLESGDILISITADLGIVGVVPDGLGEAYINQHIALVRPDLDAVNSRFVGHYMAGPIAQTYISKLNDAGAKAGLNLPTIRGLLTAKPLRFEQDLIAMRLDEIDNRIQNATTESAKLRELKAGLMHDLLTGRVRVTPLLAEAAQQQGSV